MGPSLILVMTGRSPLFQLICESSYGNCGDGRRYLRRCSCTEFWRISDGTNQVGHRFWGNNSDLGLITDFVACIWDLRAPSVSGEDGLHAMEVALAAYQSSRTGRPVFLR